MQNYAAAKLQLSIYGTALRSYMILVNIWWCDLLLIIIGHDKPTNATPPREYLQGSSFLKSLMVQTARLQGRHKQSRIETK